MRVFTVGEVAEALGTDQVTVRRWIAKGEEDGLVAEMDTKKGGYRITDESLEKFLQKHPKYARLAARSSTLKEVGKSSVGAAAINRVLKIVGSQPVSKALPFLNKEIKKARQELEAREQEITTIKENIAALQTIRNLIVHNSELPKLKEENE